MSFLSILKTIGKDCLVGVEAAGPIAVPALTALNPLAGAGLNGLLHLVATAEQLHPSVDGAKTGAAKKAWVTSTIVDIGVPFAQSILAQHGQKLTIDTQALSDAIDAAVSLFNAVDKLHSSFALAKAA